MPIRVTYLALTQKVLSAVFDPFHAANMLFPQATCLEFNLDFCAANLKAVNTVLLPVFYAEAEELQCMAHMTNNIGEDKKYSLFISNVYFS